MEEPMSKASESKPDDFQAFLNTCMHELHLKTEVHKVWGIDSFERWDLSQSAGQLIFSNPDGTKAIAPVQLIGSFNAGDQSWLWSWENPSIEAALQVDALQVREYGRTHEIEKLTRPRWNGSETEAWEMAALAAKLCEAEGDRCPFGDVRAFVTFGPVQIKKAK